MQQASNTPMQQTNKTNMDQTKKTTMHQTTMQQTIPPSEAPTWESFSFKFYPDIPSDDDDVEC